MLGMFKRGIDIDSGVFFSPGYFSSGQAPGIVKPFAEIYELETPDAPPRNWQLCEQERLSRPVRRRDDYFQLWAEILVFGIHDRNIPTAPAWMIVGFDRQGKAVSVVRYFPIFDRKGRLEDIGYQDATATFLPKGKK